MEHKDRLLVLPNKAGLEANVCSAEGQDDLILLLLVVFLVFLNRAIFIDDDRHPFPQLVNRDYFPVKKVYFALLKNLFVNLKWLEKLCLIASVLTDPAVVRSEENLRVQLKTLSLVDLKLGAGPGGRLD